jgi:hypothetical protein
VLICHKNAIATLDLIYIKKIKLKKETINNQTITKISTDCGATSNGIYSIM